MKHRPSSVVSLTSFGKDTGRWAVWVGRHALKKITRAPKGRLRRVRTPPSSARAKAGLTSFRIIRNEDAKAGPSEPQCLINGGL